MSIRTPADLGRLVSARRRETGLTQRALADRVGVSRQWIVALEKGKPGAELGLVLRTLATLDVTLSVGAPPTPVASLPDIDLDALVDRARGR